jgi:DNA-binding HxlR family transcriptional regulator
MTDRWTDENCPVARTLDLVGDRWSLLIVRDAIDGARRFSEFQRSLGIAKNILSDRLRVLVEQGILETQANEQGTRQEYVLTDGGRDLFTVIVGLRQWGERHAFSAGERHSTLVDDTAGKPVPMLRLVNGDGVELTPVNTHVRRLDD